MQTKKEKREKVLKKLDAELSIEINARMKSQEISNYFVLATNKEVRLIGEINSLKKKLGKIS